MSKPINIKTTCKKRYSSSDSEDQTLYQSIFSPTVKENFKKYLISDSDKYNYSKKSTPPSDSDINRNSFTKRNANEAQFKVVYSQSIDDKDNELIGKGAYGTILKKNEITKKIISDFPSAILEIYRGKYFKSQFLLNNISYKYNLYNKSFEIIRPYYKYTLKTWVDNQKTVSEKDIILILTRLLYGIFYMNYYGCMHRDIKPENILLNSSEDVVLADFNSFSFKKYDYSQQTTLWWRAPEIYLNQQHNKSCDIWSLGLVILYLMTGKYPIEVFNNKELDIKISKIFNISKDRLIPNLYNNFREINKYDSDLVSFCELMLNFSSKDRITPTSLIHYLGFKYPNIDKLKAKICLTLIKKDLTLLSEWENIILYLVNDKIKIIPLTFYRKLLEDNEDMPKFILIVLALYYTAVIYFPEYSDTWIENVNFEKKSLIKINFNTLITYTLESILKIEPFFLDVGSDIDNELMLSFSLSDVRTLYLESKSIYTDSWWKNIYEFGFIDIILDGEIQCNCDEVLIKSKNYVLNFQDNEKSKSLNNKDITKTIVITTESSKQYTLNNKSFETFIIDDIDYTKFEYNDTSDTTSISSNSDSDSINYI